jgi:hypothetical protein
MKIVDICHKVGILGFSIFFADNFEFVTPNFSGRSQI